MVQPFQRPPPSEYWPSRVAVGWEVVPTLPPLTPRPSGTLRAGGVLQGHFQPLTEVTVLGPGQEGPNSLQPFPQGASTPRSGPPESRVPCGLRRAERERLEVLLCGSCLFPRERPQTRKRHKQLFKVRQEEATCPLGAAECGFSWRLKPAESQARAHSFPSARHPCPPPSPLPGAVDLGQLPTQAALPLPRVP